MHIKSTTDMLPYFHALPFAKSAHIYAQEMVTLSEKEINLFIKQGYFTVKRITSK